MIQTDYPGGAFSWRNTMRVKLLSAYVVGLGVAVAVVAAQARTPTQAPTQTESQARTSPPTLDELRHAVSGLRGGRIKRPGSVRRADSRPEDTGE